MSISCILTLNSAILLKDFKTKNKVWKAKHEGLESGDKTEGEYGKEFLETVKEPKEYQAAVQHWHSDGLSE